VPAGGIRQLGGDDLEADAIGVSGGDAADQRVDQALVDRPCVPVPTQR
jgi:hypothetical protein